MKKGLVLVIVVLFAAVMALQYAQKKNRGPVAAYPQGGGEQGVALPTDAASALPEIAADFSGAFEKASGYGNIAPAAGTYGFSACENGSMEAINRSHGTVWGHEVIADHGFSPDESRAIYDQMGQLVACGIVRGGSIDACGTLPGSYAKDVSFHNSPSGQCLSAASKVLFAAYMAGMNNNPSVCHMFMASDRLKGSPLNPNDVCKAATKGLPNVCEELGNMFRARKDETFGTEIPAVCYQTFPRSKADCKTAECRELIQLYDAMKAKNPALCPSADLKQLCAAAITYDSGVCAAMQKKLSQTYCDSYAKLEKRKGAYIGMTPEEEKSARARDEVEAKAAKERQEKLDKSIRDQIK